MHRVLVTAFVKVFAPPAPDECCDQPVMDQVTVKVLWQVVASLVLCEVLPLSVSWLS